MITGAYGFITVLLVLAGVLKLLEVHSNFKLFKVLPAIVILYFLVMLMSTLGVWQQTAEIHQAYSGLKLYLLPAMIFLMLLNSDLRQIRKLGGRILLAFFAASVSIGIAFVLAFILFQNWLLPGAWKTLAALSGSWMGGMGNMAAVQMALNVPDSSMGYTLLIDSIDYAIWVMVLLALVPFAGKFGRWTGADASLLESVGRNLDEQADAGIHGDHVSGLLFLLGLSVLISMLAQWLSGMLPHTAFFTGTTWTVSIVTLAGIIGAMTPLKRLYGATELSSIMLFLIVGLLASRGNLSELTSAPVYILMGLVILLLHGTMMVVIAKLFKLDLFTCGVASLANIGGVASAPILAAAYSRALIPVGVLMAMMGYIVGTWGGLLVGKVLSVFAF